MTFLYSSNLIQLIQIPGSRMVGRRYKQFDWLHEQLVNKFRFVAIPPLPGKQIAGREKFRFVKMM